MMMNEWVIDRSIPKMKIGLDNFKFSSMLLSFNNILALMMFGTFSSIDLLLHQGVELVSNFFIMQ